MTGDEMSEAGEQAISFRTTAERKKPTDAEKLLQP